MSVVFKHWFVISLKTILLSIFSLFLDSICVSLQIVPYLIIYIYLYIYYSYAISYDN